MTDAEVYERMRCPKHRDCFGPRHNLLTEVERVAAKCPGKCDCWRHAVLRHIQASGGYIAHLMLSGQVPAFDKLVNELKERMQGGGS